MKILNFFRKRLDQFKLIFKNKDKIRGTKEVPLIFGEKEKISRTIFSPINIKKNNTLKNNVFTTPSGKDEVSVNRLTYTTPDFVKKISKLIEKPENDRKYYGFAILNVHEIYECDSKIVYSPNYIQTINKKIENKYHSDIKIGYIKEKGKPLPPEFSFKIDQMTSKARLYIDDDPGSDSWKGKDLK